MSNGGICPACGSSNISYQDGSSINDGNLTIPFICDDCGTIGHEMYSGLKFDSSEAIEMEDEGSDSDFINDDENEYSLDSDDEYEDFSDDDLDNELDSLSLDED